MKERPFHCEFFDYTCSHKSNLMKHIACAHEDKKPFNCKSCIKPLSQRSDLKMYAELVIKKGT